MLELLSVQNHAVRDAFAIVLGVAIEVRAAHVLDDYLQRSALSGFNHEGFVVFPEMFYELAVVEHPRAVGKADDFNRKSERLRLQVRGVTRKTAVPADLLQSQRTRRIR